MKRRLQVILVVFYLFTCQGILAQMGGINWTADGLAYTRFKEGNLIRVDPKTEGETILVKKEQLIPAGASTALSAQSYQFSPDNKKLLLFTNTAKVWRYRTRGDYWVLDLNNNSLRQLGKSL